MDKPKEKWEIEFDKQFDYLQGHYKKGDYECCGEVLIRKHIKSFFHSQLEQARAEEARIIRDKILKLNDEIIGDTSFGRAVLDLIRKIK